MRSPIIVVTGGIATGKTTVAAVLASRGGACVDCDALAHRALDQESVKERLRRAFGAQILTRSGKVSRAKLGETAFSSDEHVEILNRIVRPRVTGIIGAEVRRLRRRYPYIVLDAVLFFQYTFRFKVDLTVVTRASRTVRIERLMKRDGLSRKEAGRRIERQRYLEEGWMNADRTVRTDGAKRTVERIAAEIRDRFLAERGIAGRI